MARSKRTFTKAQLKAITSQASEGWTKSACARELDLSPSSFSRYQELVDAYDKGRAKYSAEKRENAPDPKSKGGSPIEVDEVMCALVREYRGYGIPIPIVAASIGMSETTFHEKTKNVPEFKEASELGFADAQRNLITSMYKTAITGNVHAQKYLANNLMPEHFQERKTLEAGPNLTGALSSMRPEDRLELLED